jgi:hypothetical protein
MVRCPAHDDAVSSLSVSTNEKGDVLLHCHSGCDKGAILEAVGLKLADLFVDNKAEATTKRSIAAEYVYLDEHENVVYKVVRYVPKDFRQAQLKDDVWTWNLAGVERIPYNLPDVIEAIAKRRWIFFVEGEKDCDTLTRMGFVATTTAGGAQSWSDKMALRFVGARVVVVPDNDPPGWEYGQTVARALSGYAAEVRVVVLPGVPKKGDVTDYFIAGGTADELKALTNAAVHMGRDEPLAERHGGPLRFQRASEVQTKRVDWLWEGHIPFGKISIIDGDPGQGKSTLTMDLAARLSSGRPMPGVAPTQWTNAPAILLSAEDDPEDTMVPRLEAAGADLGQILIVSAVKPPDGSQERPWSLPGDLEHLRALIIESGARMVVIDPLTAFFDAAINSNNDHHVRKALHPLKDLASDTGCAMVIVRHLKKSREGLALHAGGGSIGIIGAARVGMVVAADPHDETGRRKVIAVSKINVGEVPPSLTFHLERVSADVARVVWDGTSQHSAETLLAAVSPEDVEETARAAEYLKLLLGKEDVPVPDLLKKTRQMGISDKTLNRAKKMLGVMDIVTQAGVWWALDIPTDRGEP